MVDYGAWLRIGLSIDIVSGFVFLAFGAFAAFKRPRTRAGKAAGLFALGWAFVAIYPNWYLLTSGVSAESATITYAPSSIVNTLGFALVAAATLWLGRTLVTRWPRSIPGDAVLAIVAVSIVWSAYNSWNVAPSLGVGGGHRYLFVANNVLATTLTPLLIWLAVSAPEDGKGSWIALAVTPLAGAWFLTLAPEFARDGRIAPLLLISTAMVIGVPALSRRRHPRVMVWTAAWWLVALAWGWALANHRPNDLGLMGLTRILAVGILVYAVVRHRAFDIDVKLRFTLKQSTIAAVFIAVFVAVQAGVGEAVTAQAGIFAGAIATAFMVFALGPIQRLAERFAENAMPAAVPLAQRSDDDRANLFEALAREAWSDGSINAKEARVLETAWRRLGLNADQAARIESQARTA